MIRYGCWVSVYFQLHLITCFNVNKYFWLLNQDKKEQPNYGFNIYNYVILLKFILLCLYVISIHLKFMKYLLNAYPVVKIIGRNLLGSVHAPHTCEQ